MCLSIEWYNSVCRSIRHINTLENSPHRVKCHKIVMIYPHHNKIHNYDCDPREKVCFVDPRPPMFPSRMFSLLPCETLAVSGPQNIGPS